MSGKILVMAMIFSSSLAMAQDASSNYPDGSGDPDATTCRTPQPLPSSRMVGPKVCKTNSQWKLLRKNGQDISADGTQIIADPKSGGSSVTCASSGGGATNGGAGMAVCR